MAKDQNRFKRVVFKGRLWEIYNYEILARGVAASFSVNVSSNGLNFSAALDIPDPTGADGQFYFHRVVAGPDKMVQILWQDRAYPTHYLLHSQDGQHWNVVNNPFANTPCAVTGSGVVGLSEATYFGGKFWLGCNAGLYHLLSSSDGISWSLAKTLPGISAAGYSGGDVIQLVAFRNELFAFASPNVPTNSGTDSVLFRTSDGAQWNQVSVNRFPNRLFVYGDKIWDLNYRSGFATTTDGSAWTNVRPAGFTVPATETQPTKEFVLTDSYPYAFLGRIWSGVRTTPLKGPGTTTVWASSP